MPLVILHGTEHLQRKEAFDRLRAELDTDGALATNTIVLSAELTSPQEVMAACDTVPFLGDTRLVVVEGLLATAGRGKRGRKKVAVAEEDAADVGPWVVLADYIDRMPPTTTLVLIDDEAPVTGLFGELRSKGRVEAFSAPKEGDLPGWVTARAKQIGLKIDLPAVRVLAELVGGESETLDRKRKSHMGMLASELDKLAAYANGDAVRVEDVRELVGRAKEQKGWEFGDAIIAGNGSTAARLLNELVDDGRALPVILSTIAGRYRKIAAAKDMDERGEGSAAIGARLNAKGFGLEKLLDQAHRFSWAELREAYARIVQAERDFKRTDGDARVALEIVVQELAVGRRQAAARR